MYVAYDIKGIQKYIFAVPRLKSIVGGSLLIARFDNTVVGEILKKLGLPANNLIFTGGGRGLIEISDSSKIEQLQDALVDAAHEFGLDIRVGSSEVRVPEPEDLRLYPFIPLDLGYKHLCKDSGLYPVAQEKDTHEIIKEREKIIKGKNEFEESILNEVRKYLSSEDCLKLQYVRFFRNVDAQDADDYEQPETKAAVFALGRRNRWAMIYMDGNDMGRQFKALPSELDVRQKSGWWRDFSRNLDECTKTAFYQALAKTVSLWLKTADSDCYYDDRESGQRTLVLPFRPLILGGDDVAMLCHSEYAMEFVKFMSTGFTETSELKARKYRGSAALWPATDNKLTISAGILYCKTKFPLATAMTYADSLLASAKGAFRSKGGEGKPTPPGVDFDTITDSLVDSPAERRRRELWFTDAEAGNIQIHLTRRPYLLREEPEWKTGQAKNALTIGQLETEYIKPLEQDLKNSVRSLVLPGLRQPWSLRTIFLASIAKNHPLLKKRLWESASNDLAGDWWLDESGKGTKIRKTAVIDALLLLDEQRRMNQETVSK